MLAAPKAFVSRLNTPSTPNPMKTHTPGPWIETPTTGNPSKPYTVRMDVVTTSGEWNPAFVAGDMLPADAHLIAAAPDLLASLIELESMVAEMLPKHGPCGWGELALNQAREAIAKAKGNE